MPPLTTLSLAHALHWPQAPVVRLMLILSVASDECFPLGVVDTTKKTNSSRDLVMHFAEAVARCISRECRAPEQTTLETLLCYRYCTSRHRRRQVGCGLAPVAQRGGDVGVQGAQVHDWRLRPLLQCRRRRHQACGMAKTFSYSINRGLMKL